MACEVKLMNINELNAKLAEAIKAEHLLPRGMKLVGKVVSTKRKKTATVERPLVKFYSKYNRWAYSRSKLAAHIPADIPIREGDLVEIQETRKISKTKNWVVTRVVKREGEDA